MHRLCTFILAVVLIQLALQCNSQTYSVNGIIKDSKTNESLPGVNVLAGNGIGTSTDINGAYRLKLEAGHYSLIFRFVGYREKEISLHVMNKDVSLNVALEPEVLELEQVVVSAGRFEQKLSDIPVSMELLKAASISSGGATSMETALSKVPGVNILDGQANIRMGSGWSYGAGSRVLVLLDGMPLLTPDVGDAKWNYIPMESLSQVEILKGASSVLYGSSALNGVIHFRTMDPGLNPSATLSVQSGMYLPPERRELKWWKTNPLYSSAALNLARNINQHDLVGGFYLFNDAGYRTENNQKRARLSAKYRYRSKKIEGLTAGINSNFMLLENRDFFVWQNADSGAWVQNPATVSFYNGLRANFDPNIVYFSPLGHKHSFYNRFYLSSNTFPSDSSKNNNAWSYTGEYLYHFKIKKLNISSGLNASFSQSLSELFGNHNSTNAAFFTQLDYQSGPLLISGGFRYEHYRLDTIQAESKPVFRAGLNYRLSPSTFLRTSYGMGYRFPSIAEKYTYTSLGGINIFPSPELHAESGWNLEAGIKQGLKAGKWNAYIDIAGFFTSYKDMMEFMFGFYDTLTYLPTTQYFTLRNMGFQSRNVGLAQISGWECSLVGQGLIHKVQSSALISYTYCKPVDLNKDSLYQVGKAEKNEFLKYRNLHTVKSELQLEYKWMQFAWSSNYNSFMVNVDAVFVDPTLGELILPGYRDYRKNHQHGYWVNDFRFSIVIAKHSRLSAIVLNAGNIEYMGRPGDIRPPRTIVLQYNMSL